MVGYGGKYPSAVLKCNFEVHILHLSVSINQWWKKYSVVEEVLRSFTEVKAVIPQCRNTQLQVNVLPQNNPIN